MPIHSTIIKDLRLVVGVIDSPLFKLETLSHQGNVNKADNGNCDAQIWPHLESASNPNCALHRGSPSAEAGEGGRNDSRRRPASQGF